MLYLGVTRNLQRRLAEHKLHINQGFSAKYNTDKLVYYERYDRLDVAIQREKQLKNWKREWKDKLVNNFNPEWKDMAEEIGCNADYIQSVQAAYASGSLIPGSPSPHAGLDPASPDPASSAG